MTPFLPALSALFFISLYPAIAHATAPEPLTAQQTPGLMHTQNDTDVCGEKSPLIGKSPELVDFKKYFPPQTTIKVIRNRSQAARDVRKDQVNVYLSKAGSIRRVSCD